MKPTLIDTDILSYYLRGNDGISARFQEYLTYYETINISIITYYEILSGLTFKNATKQIEISNNFGDSLSIINTTKYSIKKSAEIYSIQRKKGQAIDDIDILIAGICYC
ncbi:MAG TPA: PIN domain-containing protein [Flavobacteriaceae bacterium]|nr:PIN domain-containing protein [Flavobacteriaceae bacterium]